MFNSCTFNSLKYNSRCIKEKAPISVGGEIGTIIVKQRKLRVLKTEFIDIIATKLFFDQTSIDIIGIKLISNKEFSNIVSSILLSEKLKISLKGETLNRVAQDLLFLEGKVQYPIKIEQKIVGSKKFLNSIYRMVKGKRLISSKQLEVIYGKKLVISIEHKALKGLKKVPCRQHNLIRGKKDISEILKVLDILDLEE